MNDFERNCLYDRVRSAVEEYESLPEEYKQPPLPSDYLKLHPHALVTLGK